MHQRCHAKRRLEKDHVSCLSITIRYGRPRMELRHLRYFVAVAEEENVSRAALKLHVSQPGLSRQIRDLEDELGFLLLERGAKSVRLTNAGRIFLSEAKAVLEHVNEAIAKARSGADGSKGEIHVGYAPSPTVQILPRVLRSFQEKCPSVRVVLHDLSAEEMLSQLHAKKLNAALAVKPSRKSLRGLSFVEMARYPWCVAVEPNHPLARMKSVSIEKIISELLLGYTRKDYPDYYTEIESLFASTRRKPRFLEEHDGVTSLITGIEAGHGIAIVPSCLACLAGPRLRLIPLKPAGTPIVVGVLANENPSALVKEFVQQALSLDRVAR